MTTVLFLLATALYVPFITFKEKFVWPRKHVTRNLKHAYT